MDWFNLLASAVVASAVVAALVSGLAALVTAERRIAAENVIQERTKWREKVRELADEIYNAIISGESDAKKLSQLRARLTLRLNPHDEQDQRILTLIESSDRGRAEEFTQRVSLLLKHDWERAKREASLLRRLCERSPCRLQFEDYRPGIRHNYVIRPWLYRRIVWLLRVFSR